MGQNKKMLISCQNDQYVEKSIFYKLAHFWAALPDKNFGPFQNRDLENWLKKHSKLMGPEEIHIFFWEGAPRPPKSKCDRPKNLEVFLVNFQISAS